MRELRLKYLINLVSDIAARTKEDEQALTTAQRRVQEALQRTGREASLTERVIVRAMTLGTKGAKDHADRIAYLALRYQDLRKAAEGASAALQKVQGLAAGAAAGAYTLDRFARAPMEYSARLSHMANTAYADRDVAGRVAGKRTLNAAITAAIRTGGGTRDDAAETLDNLIASGAITAPQAVRLLPMLMRGSTASGARATDLGAIALRGMQGFGIQLDQVPEVMNMAMVGGQAGGFELRDMAKWLPQAMAAGRLSGLSGTEGMRRIIASMQAQVITAGSKDEAGNNLVNLLGKINSRDTAVDMAKEGIDLAGYLAKKRGEGVNSLDAFVQMVDGIANKDADYTALRAQLAKAGTQGERQATLASMTDILQGKSIGRVVQDRQALMALVAEMNNREYISRVMASTRGNPNALDTSFGVVSQDLSFARQRALNEGAIASDNALQMAEPALRAVGNTAADAAQKFPMLTTGVVAATGALGVFAAALGATGLIGILTGRAGNAGGVVGMAGTAAVGGAVAAAKGVFTSPGMWAARAAGTVAAPVIGAGIDAYSTYANGALTADGKRRGYAGAAAGLGGGLAGAFAGAAAGSLVGPVGTLVGGVLGGLGGAEGGKAALNWLWGRDPAAGVVGPDGKPLGHGGRLELGEGKVAIDVRVTDERVQHTVGTQSSPTLKLNPGNTNPAGYRGAGGSW